VSNPGIGLQAEALMWFHQVTTRWSELFLPGSSWVALQLQLCLVSSSHSKVGQLSFECCPLFLRSAPGSTIYPALGGWPVAPSPFSVFVFFLNLLGASGSFGRLACHPNSCSQLLCLSLSLLCAGSSFGRLACHPAPTLSLCCFTCALAHLRVWC
jgi:hypothetical protein